MQITETAPPSNENDNKIISEHLSTYQGGVKKPDIGSNILFGAIDDLDMDNVSLPVMPTTPIVQSNWEEGVSEGAASCVIPSF